MVMWGPGYIITTGKTFMHLRDNCLIIETEIWICFYDLCNSLPSYHFHISLLLIIKTTAISYYNNYLNVRTALHVKYVWLLCQRRRNLKTHPLITSSPQINGCLNMFTSMDDFSKFALVDVLTSRNEHCFGLVLIR